MKKLIFFVFSALLFVSCYSTRMSGSPAAVSAGASIGGMLGSIVGERAGGYGGSQFGALLGTVAGAAIGNAVTTPREEQVQVQEQPVYHSAQSEFYDASSGLEVTNIRFIDNNRNQSIDAGESCKIIFEVINNGRVAAYNVVPVVEEVSGLKYLQVSPSAQISYIDIGSRIRYTATVNAGKRLKTGEAVFRIYTTESNGAVSDTHEFSIPTYKK